MRLAAAFNHPQANIGQAQQSLDQPYSIDRVAAIQRGFVDHVTRVAADAAIFACLAFAIAAIAA